MAKVSRCRWWFYCYCYSVYSWQWCNPGQTTPWQTPAPKRPGSEEALQTKTALVEGRDLQLLDKKNVLKIVQSSLATKKFLFSNLTNIAANVVASSLQVEGMFRLLNLKYFGLLVFVFYLAFLWHKWPISTKKFNIILKFYYKNLWFDNKTEQELLSIKN